MAAVAPPPADEAWFPSWLGPPLLVMTFVALTRWSWRKWPDVLVDFGCQLYIPWRITEGSSLYLDIDYKDGPLSQYVNALLFSLFGVSLGTLVWANLALLGILCALIYVMFARACGPFTATLAVFVQLVVFSFSQYTGIGNYNYVTSYSQEQTHGFLLAVVMIFALGEYTRLGRVRWAAAAGIAFGLTSLTKAELTTAALIAAVFGFGLAAWTQQAARLRAALLAFGAGAVVPVLLCVALLATRMPWATAFGGAAGNWLHLRGDILDYKFYRDVMGMEAPLGNALRMLGAFGLIAAVVGLAGAIAWALRGRRWGRVPAALAVGAAFGLALVVSAPNISWMQVGRALPITAALGLVAFTGLAVVRCGAMFRRARYVPLATLGVFALMLLAKVALDVRISHYGFVLALPATLVLIATLVHLVPASLDARGTNGAVARALLTAPILAAALFFLQRSNQSYASKNTVVGTGGDTIVTTDATVDVRGRDLQLAVDRLRVLMPPGSSLLALPDGMMLNYWLRSTNPTRHVYFVPWSLAFAGGEAVVLSDIQTHAPDFIALVHRRAGEYGFAFFGDEGFGSLILPWVRAHYRRVELIGLEPFTTRGFGIVLMARIPPTVQHVAADARATAAYDR